MFSTTWARFQFRCLLSHLMCLRCFYYDCGVDAMEKLRSDLVFEAIYKHLVQHKHNLSEIFPKPEGREQLKLEYTAQARVCQALNFRWILEKDKCFSVLFGEMLFSIANLHAGHKHKWSGRRIMAEGFKLTATGSKSDGNNGGYTVRWNRKMGRNSPVKWISLCLSRYLQGIVLYIRIFMF